MSDYGDKGICKKEFKALSDQKGAMVHGDTVIAVANLQILGHSYFPQGKSEMSLSPAKAKGAEIEKTKEIGQYKGPTIATYDRLEGDQLEADLTLELKDFPKSLDTVEVKDKKTESQLTQRLSVFKRVTSMVNLKNCKERQRQFIKKTAYLKNDSSKNALDVQEFIQDDKTISNDLSEREKLHGANENLKEYNCKMCNKNFRKAVTMIRHLNTHKRNNLREVYFILKEIREKRKAIPNENRSNSVNHINEITSPEYKNSDVRELRKRKSVSLNYREYTPDASLYDDNSDDEFFDNRIVSEESLEGYSLIRHQNNLSCNVCNGQFFGDVEFKIHREHCGHHANTASLEQQSETDDRSALKLINLWIREELDSDSEGKGFNCNKCSKSYATKKSLIKHETKMHENFSRYCTTCNGVCRCPDRNMKNDDKPQEKTKPYTCEECNKTFEKEVKLEKHMSIHARAKEQQDTNFKRFLCHICSKTFRQNTGLMFHMRTHTGYKPHVCKYCGRGFTSNSNCVNHERTHTGDRPFVCHFCSAAFAKSCTLKAHITTHTGEANYHCKTCGKSFRRLKYLKEHKFTHTGEKPYVCKICGTAYSHSGSLFVHEKKCKAQHDNYQMISISETQNYCQTQIGTVETSSINVPHIITSLPTSQHLITINSSSNAKVNMNYEESVPRINSQCETVQSIGAHVHSNFDNPDTLAVRSLALMGQMFNS